jgi:TPR repeat protein
MHKLATFPHLSRVETFESPLSEEEAWSWLVRAAELGCRQAQYDAGAYLATGDWGNGQVVKQDLAAAVAWYRLAAEAGQVDAQFTLATMLMNGEGCERDLVAARTWLKRAIAGGYKDPYAAELLTQLDSVK